MGMTIDEAIPIIHDMYNYYSDEMVEPYVGFDADDKQAIETALDTMRKYQQIEQIIDDWNNGKFSDAVGCLRVKAVVEDGKA